MCHGDIEKRIRVSKPVVNHTFRPISYFSALYLAPILAIVIKVCWEDIYSSFELMEPFERLAKDGGASTELALFAQYLSSSISMDVFKLCFSGCLMSTSDHQCLSACHHPTPASTSMTVKARSYCEISQGNIRRCDPAWIVEKVILRCVEAILSAGVVPALPIIVISWRYQSNITSNPASIVYLAPLMNDEPVIQDFEQADSAGNESDFLATLHNQKYQLQYHDDATGIQRYGITQRLPRYRQMSQHHHMQLP